MSIARPLFRAQPMAARARRRETCRKNLSISDSLKARNRIPSSVTYVRELVDETDEPQHAVSRGRETPPLPLPALEPQRAVSWGRETPSLPVPAHRHYCRNCLRAELWIRLHASVKRIQHLQEGAARAPRCPRIQPHDVRDWEHAARWPLTDLLTRRSSHAMASWPSRMSATHSSIRRHHLAVYYNQQWP